MNFHMTKHWIAIPRIMMVGNALMKLNFNRIDCEKVFERFSCKFQRPELRKPLPELKDLRIENNNIQIADLEGPNFSVTSELEKLNVNRIDHEFFFERFFQNVNFPELRELSMVICHVDSEFPFFDKMLPPKIEKLDLDDNNFDNIPLEFAAI